jgi:hypothetical protein
VRQHLVSTSNVGHDDDLYCGQPTKMTHVGVSLNHVVMTRTEGLIVLGLLDAQRIPGNTFEALAEGSVRPTITDGDHVSVRWCRLTAVGAWEHSFTRVRVEGRPTGGAARPAAPIRLLYVLGPGAEVRGG